MSIIPIPLLLFASIFALVALSRRFWRNRSWGRLFGLICVLFAFASAISAWHAFMELESLRWTVGFGLATSFATIGAMRWLMQIRS